jgi:DNA replication protein DnaC
MSCQALRNIPEKKINDILYNVYNSCEKCKGSNTKCQRCITLNKAFTRYSEANIPVRYWELEMNNFSGDDVLKKHYEDVVKDLKKTYQKGTGLCFAGSFGLGKTMVCSNILKRAVEKGFSALYVTLTDIVSVSTSNERYEARNELISVDFLVIDEFDPRYMGNTDTASDFFGRIVEDIFRTRSQNCLPTFMCTNSQSLTDAFHGTIKESISSLMNEVNTIIVLGSDHRKIGQAERKF